MSRICNAITTSSSRRHRFWFETLYKDKWLYMGEAMCAALLLDVGTYFVGLVRPVYARTRKGHFSNCLSRAHRVAFLPR
jgi:hypothetical protein